MMFRPIMTAVLASHNRRETTLACLDALLACDRPVELRVVLFDDGSTDGTADAIHERHPTVTLLAGHGDAFWAGGMRIAFAAAIANGSDFILWLNDDVQLAPDALTRLIDTHDALAAAGRSLCLVGGAVADWQTGRTTYAGIKRPFPRRPLRLHRQPPDASRATECDTLVGNVVLVPHLTTQTIGGIDPAYRHTLADLDYGLRVTAAGGCCVLAAGHVGWCAANRRQGRWFNPELPLRARWTLLTHPLGFPPRPWLHFARRHGGPAWWLFALLPFWRLIAPVALARWIDRRRARVPEVGHA